MSVLERSLCAREVGSLAIRCLAVTRRARRRRRQRWLSLRSATGDAEIMCIIPVRAESFWRLGSLDGGLRLAGDALSFTPTRDTSTSFPIFYDSNSQSPNRRQLLLGRC